MKSINVVHSLTAIILTLFSSLSFAQRNYDTEEITIQVDKFNVVGDLHTPKEGTRHPLIIFVAGDGSSSRVKSLPLLKNYGYFDLFINNGFAILIYDKPGNGKSTGEFTKGNLFHERASIVSKWVEALANHSFINSKQIGLAGGSQAGYVMPLVCNMNEKVAFLLCQSCPAMNSVNQSAFLIKQQTLCAGLSSDDSEKAYNYYIQSCLAKDYHEYLEAAEYLAKNPVVKILRWDHIQTEDKFNPYEPNSESLFDPTTILKKIKIPVLALFGEKDKLVDPLQGSEAYKKALTEAGNEYFQVNLIPGVDHTISDAVTGCLDELMKKQVTLNKEARSIVSNWLVGLKKHMD